MKNELGDIGASEQVAENPSILTARAIVDALVEKGVTRFAYCPGSRNAPFAYALTELERAGRVSVHPFAEERGAGFWALGAIKGEPGTPVAVVTTSGTAVTELHPAMAEAHHQGLPLIAVTADRPFEARGVGANQTTDQVGIFASAPVAQLDVPALSPADDPGLLSRLKSRVHRTVMLAQGLPGVRGPAHINVALGEPLVPMVGGEQPVLDAVSGSAEPATQRAAVETVAFLPRTPWMQVVDPDLPTILVVGDADGSSSDSDVRALAAQACELGIPMIAEPTSGVCDLPNWLPHGPLIADRIAQDVQQIVVLGRPTLSRPLSRLQSLPGVTKIVVGDQAEWPDEAGNATVYVDRLVPDWGLDEGDEDPESAHQERERWAEFCVELSNEAELIVEEASTKDGGMNHFGVARTIWDSSADTALWLGASNVIRAFDTAASGNGNRMVYANRGLAGIDGTVASALGLQSALGVPVRAVVGDLTFCYDLPSLAARPEQEQDIQVIVFDDEGGSIFASLEHGKAADEGTYDKYFRVRQSIDVCAVARGCGWSARSVNSMRELEELLDEPVEGRSVIRVPLVFPTRMMREVRLAATKI